MADRSTWLPAGCRAVFHHLLFTTMKKTKVIFRVWKNGEDVIALFPEIVVDGHLSHCQSYERVGQHGAADPRTVILESYPATEKEYAELKKELERRGYEFQVVKRLSPQFTETRRKEMGL